MDLLKKKKGKERGKKTQGESIPVPPTKLKIQFLHLIPLSKRPWDKAAGETQQCCCEKPSERGRGHSLLFFFSRVCYVDHF